MLLHIHCFDSSGMMTLCDMCSVTCRSFQTLWNKFVLAFETILLGSLPIFSKDNLACFHYVICTEPFPLLYDQEFAVVIYNTKIMLVIYGNDVSSYRFPWPSWYFMEHVLLFCHVGWKSRQVGHFFYNFLCVSININPIYGLMCQ